MKTKHTIGNWYYNNNDPKNTTTTRNVWVKKQTGSWRLAHVWGAYPEESEANAKLIAAAPELLEALQSVLAYEQRCADKGNPMIGNGILSIIHKAIKKATK